MAYGDFTDLAKRTAADKVLKDKEFNIVKDPKYDGYQRGLVSMVYKFFDKKTKGSGVTTLANKSAIKSIPQNEHIAEELHKPIIKKFNKIKVYSAFKNYIWAADLADMQLISTFNKGFRYLLCVIDIFSKYAWVVPLKDKKSLSIVNAFQKILTESTRKPHKIWVAKGSEFYNFHFKRYLKNNSIEMYSTHNEGKSVNAERSIRTIKNKIYKYMTVISKNVYIDKLDDIVHKYNKTYRRSIKMRPIDVKDNTYIDFGKEVNDKDFKFKVGDHVRISKYKSIFAKAIPEIGLRKSLSLKKLKMQLRGLMLLMILMVKKILKHSMKTSCKGQTKKNLEWKK